MEEGGEPEDEVGLALLEGDGVVQHGERVGEDVLVPVDRVLLEPQQGQLGDELAGDPDLGRKLEDRRGRAAEEELGELLPDALGRDDLQPVVHGGDGGHHLGVDAQVQRRGEAQRPQHAQRVVPEGHLR